MLIEVFDGEICSLPLSTFGVSNDSMTLLSGRALSMEFLSDKRLSIIAIEGLLGASFIPRYKIIISGL